MFNPVKWFLKKVADALNGLLFDLSGGRGGYQENPNDKKKEKKD